MNWTMEQESFSGGGGGGDQVMVGTETVGIHLVFRLVKTLCFLFGF